MTLQLLMHIGRIRCLPKKPDEPKIQATFPRLFCIFSRIQLYIDNTTMPKIYTCRDIPAELVQSLKADKIALVDSEFTGLDVGRTDRLCLVQICGKDSNKIYLVQPNQQYETPNLVKVLEDPSIEIVIHFSRKDKNAIEHFLKPKCKITNIFDSKVASRLVRKYSNEHGLASLCQEFAGVRLEKKMASSDWAKDISQYSTKEQAYAAADVQYLFLIKTKLEAMLKREKKYDIFLKCMAFIDTRVELDNLGVDKIFDH
jgi:ribonuclease D